MSLPIADTEALFEAVRPADLLPGVRTITVGTTVLLHTEIMSAHLLVHNGRLTGLFDFEPAMHGAPEYEFAAVGPFLSQGNGDFLRAMLTAYGCTTIDEQVQRRLLAYFLLHRYGTLTVAPTSATTLDELAEHWWHVS